MESFNEEVVYQWATTAEPWQAIAFMVACAERMLPNYEKFATNELTFDVQPLRRALDAAWRWLETDAPIHELNELIAACEAMTPNTEIYSSPYTSAALDAAVSAAVVLEASRSYQPSQVVEVATLGRDTIDLWLQRMLDLSPDDPDFENALLSHEMMQQELRTQREIREQLSSFAGSRSDVISSFRKRWHQQGSGSITM